MHILIPERILPEQLERLKAAHDVHYDANLVNDAERYIEHAKEADAIIIRNMSQLRGPLLESMKKCRVIGRLGVGLDNIDVESCKKRDIRIIPATGANAQSVAEYVITTAMMLRRRSYLGTDKVADGLWPKMEMVQGREIAGATLGIVGLGSIGRLVARLARNVGMKTIAYDANAGQSADDNEIELVSFDELLRRSDIVTLHIPKTPETTNLFNSDVLDRMAPGAILINSARGGVVDDEAVVRSLKKGHLGGAALDVFESEPLGPTSYFKDVPNLVLTPHIAGVTQDSEQRVTELVVTKVLEFLEGNRSVN